MKIALVSRRVFPFHGYGGMEKYVYFLARSLAKLGHHVDVISSSKGNKSIEKEFKDGINFIFLPVKVEGFVPLQILKYHIFSLKVSKMLKDYDIVHSFGWSAFYYLMFKNKIPVILQAFDNESFKIEWWKRALIFFPINLPLLLAAKRCKAIASCGSRQDKEIVDIYGVGPGVVKRVSDGVDVHSIHDKVISLASKRSGLRDSLDIPKDAFVIINVNRLAPTKNVDLIIRAFSKVKSPNKEIRLIIVGSGPEEEKLRKLESDLGLKDDVLHFKGIPDDRLYELLSISDIFIEASKIEYVVITALEAMSAGLPVISFHDQEGILGASCGFVCDVMDENSLASALDKACISDLTEKGKAAYSAVLEKDWENVAKEAVKAYSFAAGINGR